MNTLHARLKLPWSLRGWSDGRALVSRSSGEQRDLPDGWSHVAESCDGRTDFESPAFTPYHRTILRKLIELGLAEECRHGAPLEPWQPLRTAPNPRFRGLHWSVTGRCNLACRHCFMEAPSNRYGELPLGDMLGLVERFRRANIPRVVLTGGEPFLRRDLGEIVAALAGADIAVCSVYTNALLADDERLAIFPRHGFSPLFQVSFDGLGAHDAMRGLPGSEATTLAAMRRIRARGLRLSVSTSIDRLGRDSLTGTYELLAGLGIEAWGISAPQASGNWRGSTTGLTLEEEAALYEPLLRRWQDDGRPFFLQLGGLFKGGTGEGPAIVHRHAREDYDCATCREFPALLPDGTLLPCPGYTGTPIQERMPNLLRTDLSEAWTASPLRDLVDRRKEDILRANPGCAECGRFADCGMGCRALALSETGDATAPDPVHCRVWTGGLGERFRCLGGRKPRE
jgi:radical SAM protein with 4Fe4S-binding SPASM domain